MVLVEIAGALDKVGHLPGGVEAVQATVDLRFQVGIRSSTTGLCVL